ncbi:piggyBac transposable element-derived protein 4-like [Mastacembelus armatus]|uniref:piggyBac transposable element-derived protein 4-like n=1 Tax=Mastacembelus armatus TaxID=205130 RepID=UPI000E45BDAE|nr:piggyBac transposable element-derived protein 4-like [Mastacembelus armatus]
MAAYYTADQVAKAKRKLDKIFALPNREDPRAGESDDSDEGGTDSSEDLSAESIRPENNAEGEGDGVASDGGECNEDENEDNFEEGDVSRKSTEDEDDDGEGESILGDDTDEDYNDVEDDDRYSTEEEDDGDDQRAGVHVHPDTFLSKDKKIEWSSEPLGERAQRGVPEYPTGPTGEAIAGARDILSCFLLFFTAELEEIVLRESNRSTYEGSSQKSMDETNLRAYMGLLTLAGMYRSRGEATSSLCDAEHGRTIFRATMSLKEFHCWSRMLRFDDRKSRGIDGNSPDKLAAIREVWSKWSERLPALYNPGPAVTVDERMVPFKGRCSFRQYMPNKPAKYGLKLWVACDAKSSYAWRMQAYTGKEAVTASKSTERAAAKTEVNLASRVVLDLTRGLEHRLVTCDNFFTSYDLARRLRANSIDLLGTIRSNRVELPQELLTARGRKAFSSRFAFTELATLISYVPKRNRTVLLLSTRHSTPEINGECKRMKPQAIVDYNHTKGGVDNLDKLLATYSCRRMTKRWPVAMFHNILDVSVYNAYVIWRETHPEWMSGKRNRRRLFLEQLGHALVTPFILCRKQTPRAESARALMRGIRSNSPVSSRKRQRCQLCPRSRDAKTCTVCMGCKRYICGKCTLHFCAICSGIDGE